MKKIIYTLLLSALLLALISACAVAEPVPVRPAADIGDPVLSGIQIAGVDEPSLGEKLDVLADVSTKEGIRWEIPVFWVNENAEIADVCAENGKYTPVLVFYLPAGYQAQLNEDGLADIRLDPWLEAVFKPRMVVLYVESKGITFITGKGIDPPLLQEIDFMPENTVQKAATSMMPVQIPEDSRPYIPPVPDPVQPEEPEEKPDYVDLYCSRTAKASVEAEELSRIVDMIVNRIQPQAVNLLMESFPAFQEAAAVNGLSKEIGLYVYYNWGDFDNHAHLAIPGIGALSEMYPVEREDGSIGLGHIMRVNLEPCLVEDENGMLVADTESLKWKDLEQTILHETMHMIMFDYNRGFMFSWGDPGYYDIPRDEDVLELAYDYSDLVLVMPWFREGIASCVQNGYNFSSGLSSFKGKETPEGVIRYDEESVLSSYTTLRFGQMTYVLSASSNVSDYESGYMAVLYLSELMARHDESIGSSVTYAEDGTASFDSVHLRQGLNRILECLHQGQTLDEVIRESSEGRYASTQDFEARFIKGTIAPDNDDGACDRESLDFCVSLLNYLGRISEQNGALASGSILSDFEDGFGDPFDSDREEESDWYRIQGSDGFVLSTADIAEPYMDGGRSIRAGDMPPSSEIYEMAMAKKDEEWDGMSDTKWNEAEPSELVSQLLNIKYPGNLDRALKELEARDDFRAIVLTAVDAGDTKFSSRVEKAGYDIWEWELEEEQAAAAAAVETATEKTENVADTPETNSMGADEAEATTAEKTNVDGMPGSGSVSEDEANDAFIISEPAHMEAGPVESDGTDVGIIDPDKASESDE